MEATSFVPENLTRGTTNHNNMDRPSLSFGFEIFHICLSIITSIVGFIGNGLVIFLTGCRMKTTVNSIWFLNLAIADFIFILAFILIIFIGLTSYRSYMGVLFMVLDLNLFASIFFLVVISLDRCLCTWMAVWAQNNRTVLRARIICIIVWVLAIGCILPFFFEKKFSTMFLGAYPFLVGFLIPFLIIASSHIAIGVRIKHLKVRKQLKSYRVIIAVILAFFICSFPFFVCRFCAVKSCSSDKTVILTSTRFTFYLVFLNNCLNPILYVFMCDEYKKKLKQSLLLVLETAFAEDHLDFSRRSTQKHTQNQTNSFELFESVSQK